MDLAARVAQHEQWYHTLELGPGLVTPGWYDLRSLPARLPLRASLAGLRCLDVGTFDGFWAFEMERRGAAEVVAIDVVDPLAWDWPAGSQPSTVEAIARRKHGGAGFRLAAEALGSRARWEERSIHDLDPGELGTFDLVYVGSLLLHLRDPVGALAQAAAVCRGSLLVVDAIDLPLSLRAPRRALAGLDAVGRPWWWLPNVAALRRMVAAAGLTEAAPPRVVRMPAGAAHPRARPRPAALRSREVRRLMVGALWGEPHAAILARPRPGAQHVSR